MTVYTATVEHPSELCGKSYIICDDGNEQYINEIFAVVYVPSDGTYSVIFC